MYLYESKVGKKFQTVVPMQVRESAGIQEGDCLIWEAKPDGSFLVRPQKSKTEYLANLNRRAYGSIENVEQHMKMEKESWND